MSDKVIEMVARAIFPNAFIDGPERWRKRHRVRAINKAKSAIFVLIDVTPDRDKQVWLQSILNGDSHD